MNAFKATYYINNGHEIKPIVCKEITDTAVVIIRPEHEKIKLHTNSDIIYAREMFNVRYCKTINEAVDFLDDKYQEKIDDLQSSLFTCTQKKQSLLNEVAA